MVEARDSKLSSHWWWFEAEKNTYKNRSPWLQSTLAELDRKTNAILRIIEGDADSFAQRAEMFYKKQPELISMVRDYYRGHRLLVEGYSETFDLEESDMSEVDDPEPEEVQVEKENGAEEDSVCIGVALKLMEEIERMEEEARALKDMKWQS